MYGCMDPGQPISAPAPHVSPACDQPSEAAFGWIGSVFGSDLGAAAEGFRRLRIGVTGKYEVYALLPAERRFLYRVGIRSL